MGWRDHTGVDERMLIWVGGDSLFDEYGCEHRLTGRSPPEHGWYHCRRRARTFDVIRRVEQGEHPAPYRALLGYFVGRSFVGESSLMWASGTIAAAPAHLVPDHHQWHIKAHALIVRHAVDGRDHAVYAVMDLEDEVGVAVLEAYEDRKISVADIKGVTPALDAAFRYMTRLRQEGEDRARRAQEERERAAREEQARALVGTAVGRRELAAHDFAGAARAALRVAGAEYLDSRRHAVAGQMVVTYRFMGERLGCVVDTRTMRVIDSGVCLTDHRGVKGDTWFTLESLPGVVKEAIETDRLVVYRHG